MDRPQQGKVAFITGAARGQGRGHAVKLASQGADIIAVDILEQIPSVPYPMSTPDDMAETVKLVEDTGSRIVTYKADVRDLATLHAALQAGLDELGRLDIVIANAGIAPMNEVENTWRDVVDVNLTGVFHTIKAALPTMLAQGTGGSIVLISSSGGLIGVGAGMDGSIGYTASKHGLVGLMRAYANYCAPHSIRVNSIHPCGVDTPMMNNEFTIGWVEKIMAAGEGAADMSNPMPVGFLEVEDITNAVAWLVSNAARYVTGVALPVDAGFVNKH